MNKSQKNNKKTAGSGIKQDTFTDSNITSNRVSNKEIFLNVPKSDTVELNNSRRFNFSKRKGVGIIDLQDENIKLKVEIRKQITESNHLRIENNKMHEENLKNLRLIEEILHEAGKSATDLIQNILNEETNINYEKNKKEFSLSQNNFIRLREVYVIKKLKNYIHILKENLKVKEEEIENYKTNSKIMKYVNLENKYNSIINQLVVIENEYERLKSLYTEMTLKNKIFSEENEYFKNQMCKNKLNYEESKTKIKLLEDENKQLTHTNKLCEDKITYYSKFTHRDNKINLNENEKLKIDNQNLKSNLNLLESENKQLKEKIKILTKKIESTNENLRYFFKFIYIKI